MRGLAVALNAAGGTWQAGYSAQVLLASLDFHEVSVLQRAGDWAEAGRLPPVETQAVTPREAMFETVMLGLRTFTDSTGESDFGGLFAMSVLSLLPVFG